MRNSIIAGILLLASATPLLAQTNNDDLAQLKQRVTLLEKQVQDMSQLLEPVRAQQEAEKRRQAAREKFTAKMAQDQAKYTQQQLNEAEALYQVANKQWGSPESTESLQSMIQKYPDINRTGCAVLYLAQNSQGEEQARHLKDCLEKYPDCFYGDGVQVGVYARFLLIQNYQKQGETDKAKALEEEIRTRFPDAIDHNGNLIVNSLKAGTK